MPLGISLLSLSLAWLLVAHFASDPALAVEFEAGIGPTIHDRCHMDYCGLSTIQLSVPIAVLHDGTLFAVSGQVWGENYDPNTSDDEYAHPPKSIDPKKSFIEMVFCSKTRPYVFSYVDDLKKWQADPLKPGDDEAVAGFDESAYQTYWAACHHFFPKSAFDPLVHKLAPKLGYHSEGGRPDGDDAITQPMDLMRKP